MGRYVTQTDCLGETSFEFYQCYQKHRPASQVTHHWMCCRLQDPSVGADSPSHQARAISTFQSKMQYHSQPIMMYKWQRGRTKQL